MKLRILSILLILSVLVSGLFINVKTVKAVDWYGDPAWGYRKSFTISRASGAVTNYQFPLKIYYGVGTDGTEIVGNITAGKMYCNSLCQTDFDDIRVTNSDGETLMDYWVETVTASTSEVIWIEHDSIGAGATTFYMYYGNAGASSVSNGANTFILFDDFEWGNNGDDVSDSGGNVTWEQDAPSHALISTAQKLNGTRSARVVASSGYYFMNSPLAPTSNMALITHQYLTNSSSSGNVGWLDSVNKWNAVNLGGWGEIYSIDWTWLAHLPGVAQWFKLEFRNFNFTTHTFDLSIDNAAPINVDAGTTGWWDQIFIQDGGAGTGNDIYTDLVIVRNWRATEPAWGSWGSIEYNPAISNTPNSKAFGIVTASTTYYAKGTSPSNPVTDGDCTFTMNNTSAIAIDIGIKATNFTGGTSWTLGTPAENVTRITAYYSGQNPASGVVLTTSDQPFYDNLTAASTKMWDFKMETPTSFTDGVAKTSTITLTATAD